MGVRLKGMTFCRLLKEKQGSSSLVRFEKALILAKRLGDKVYERRANRGLAAASRLQVCAFLDIIMHCPCDPMHQQGAMPQPLSITAGNPATLHAAECSKGVACQQRLPQTFWNKGQHILHSRRWSIIDLMAYQLRRSRSAMPTNFASSA